MDSMNMDMNVDQTHYRNPYSPSSSAFYCHYIAYSPTHDAKDHLESGNKIIMPASALSHLATLPIDYPMLFRIENVATGFHSHCGVLEFTADEGFVVLPTWMMNNIQLEEGGLVKISNTSLPKGNYIKIQPHETKFTALSDHKSLLEKTFRDFSCLTVGDTVVVDHEEEKYMIDILETKPSPAAVSLFETDCEVEFATPLDYKEPEKKPTSGRQLRGKRLSGDDNRSLNTDQPTKKCKSKDLTTKIDGKQMKKPERLSGDDNRSIYTDQPTKKFKSKDLTTKINGKQMKKPEIEFKPFMGVGRRLDGQPLAPAEEEKEDEQSNIQVMMKEKVEGFKAFTGKSFRLG